MKIGDSVKIKDGNIDPDTGIKLDGFVGRIKEYLASNLVNMEWDSVSLQNLPDDYIRSAIKENCDYLSYNIEPKDLELCAARDNPADVIKTIRKLGEKWDNIAVFGENAELVEEIEEAGWRSYLNNHLNFPFTGRVIESNGRMKSGMLIQVLKLNDEDDFRGILIKGKMGKRTIHYTLSELEVVDDKQTENPFLVNLYREYFWNK